MEIQDFGEKIGGAKKDLWRERGLIIDDLSYMNDAEKTKLITKDNVWKRPNYQQMVDNGLPVRVVYFIKLLRDAAPTKPVIFYYDNGNIEKIKQKQEGFVEFVGKLRDYAMNLSTEEQILRFFDDFMCEYVTYTSKYSVNISPYSYGCIDNKLLQLMKMKDFESIDADIRVKQFCYNDEQKVLSMFKTHTFDNDKVRFIKDYYNRNVLLVQQPFGNSYVYVENEFDNPENWKENTVFIELSGDVIANNLATVEDAKQYILSNYKIEKKNKGQTQKSSKKKKFVPEQLKNIQREGEDFRKDKNITGEDMLENFKFKGGEFGNWLNENDRQYSLNYGFDALMDLSKALSISPEDISLGNRLSIAFGSRGSGSFLAHYEPDREVINLTKMKGAGSLAHEWGHALDDIVGKKLGYSGFITERSYTNDIMKDIVETMKYKTVSDEETTKMQKEEYEKILNRLKNFVDTFFPKEHLTEEQIQQKDELIQKLINNSEKAPETLFDYISKGSGNKEIDDLSELRKKTVGRIIPKEERIRLAHLQNNVCQAKSKIGKEQRVETEYYKDSKRFDDEFAKTDHGYWQSTVEMFARAFACYVLDKLGYKSDYLCGHAETAKGEIPKGKEETEVIKAFPVGEERVKINEKIDKFIEFLKEKEILHNHDFEKSNTDYEDYDYSY